MYYLVSTVVVQPFIFYCTSERLLRLLCVSQEQGGRGSQIDKMGDMAKRF